MSLLKAARPGASIAVSLDFERLNASYQLAGVIVVPSANKIGSRYAREEGIAGSQGTDAEIAVCECRSCATVRRRKAFLKELVTSFGRSPPHQFLDRIKAVCVAGTRRDMAFIQINQSTDHPCLRVSPISCICTLRYYDDESLLK